MSEILLVEPDWPLAKSISGYLRNRGHSVRWQPNAENGVKGADQYHPDLVLLQLQLPLHSGVEFLYEFRSYGDWSTIPVVMYGNIVSSEVGSPASLQQLGISSYHHMPTSSVGQLAIGVERALEVVVR